MSQINKCEASCVRWARSVERLHDDLIVSISADVVYVFICAI